MIRRSIVALLLALALAGCIGFTGDPTVPPHSGPPVVTLTVYAASSLKGALEAAASAYETAVPQVRITISTDSSAALETQIEQGAPADLFLSADTTNPAKLVAGGFAWGDPVDFAGNTLVIIVPKGDRHAVKEPFDLAALGVRIVAAGDEVPITKYAMQVIHNLAALPYAAPGFEAAYAANVVSKEDNVKAVVAKIELGEGDAAIVYATDAGTSTKVDTLAITPTTANVQVTCAGVVVGASPNKGHALDFLTWLANGDGQAILGSFGFLPPGA